LGTVVVSAAGRRRCDQSHDAIGRRLWVAWVIFFATGKLTTCRWGLGRPVSGVELLVWTNNGGLALASFLRHVAALLVNGLLDLDADVFQASSRWLLLCGVRRHWISRSELTGSAYPFLGWSTKLHFLAGAMGHVKALITKILKQVEKVMVAMIGDLKWRSGILEAMKMVGTGSSCVSGVSYLAGVALA
jgi:hypothetical protein